MGYARSGSGCQSGYVCAAAWAVAVAGVVATARALAGAVSVVADTAQATTVVCWGCVKRYRLGWQQRRWLDGGSAGGWGGCQ